MRIMPPTTCPSCESILVWVKDRLYCQSDTCPAKNNKRVEHFAKTLKIKGLGPNTIQKLDLSNIPEIYDLTKDFLVMQLGSEKIAVKLVDEINKSRSASLNNTLPAMGIPLVGKTAVDKLAKVIKTLDSIDAESCKKAGLGPKVTENLLKWLESREYDLLPLSREFSNNPETNKGVVCITGKLSSYPTKAVAHEVLKDWGYKVVDNLTKEVTILINESGKSTDKTRKAEQNGVQIVTNMKEMENI